MKISDDYSGKLDVWVKHPGVDPLPRTPVNCLSGNDLLKSKKRANCPQDQLDIRFLEKKKETGIF
jgi:hypothetical protein